MPADPARRQTAPTPPLDMGPQWPVTWRFREEIANQEPRGHGGYRARNGDALGAYQLTPIALEDIGWRDTQGRWSAQSGVTSDEEFLNTPQAQERALNTFLSKNWHMLESSGSTRYIGQMIQGINGDFPITENGLAAAMHRAGEPAVKAYLAYMKQQGWVSDEDSFPEDREKEFRRIEKRLREFVDIPYRRPFGH